MTQQEFLVQIAQCLEAAGIPFMVTGSYSSSHYGQPRTTNDVDAEQLEDLLRKAQKLQP